MRARLEPAQRWMPEPKATWRFAWPIEDDLVGAVEDLGVAVGRGEAEEHPVAGVHRAPDELRRRR